MSVIAVFGGAFSPPHVGHAMVASWVKLTGLADLVVLVPAANHPFGKSMASFDLRIKMCEALAMDLGSWAKVSEWERLLPRPNYTINLLRALRDLYQGREGGFLAHPDTRVRCVMGVDNLLARDKWFGVVRSRGQALLVLLN